LFWLSSRYVSRNRQPGSAALTIDIFGYLSKHTEWALSAPSLDPKEGPSISNKGVEVAVFSIKNPLHAELKQPWVEAGRWMPNQ
jgi:hypothetical protein